MPGTAEACVADGGTAEGVLVVSAATATGCKADAGLACERKTASITAAIIENSKPHRKNGFEVDG